MIEKFEFYPLIYFFTDPVLRGPTIGSMLMCLAAALVGVIAFLRKQSLLGESLSHAAYPGVIIGVIIASTLQFTDAYEFGVSVVIIAGACITSMAGLVVIYYLERYLKVRSDSALCFVLSAFFGIGITIASRVQFTYAALYNQIQAYLYGQAATMHDTHIFIYGGLSAVILLAIIFLYKEWQALTFDREYSQSIGFSILGLDVIFFILIVLAVVVGIRSVGVVLMSAMLIAPAVAARQYTNRMDLMFLYAALFGLFSGLLGNILSTELTKYFFLKYPNERIAIPTGPMIVIVISSICIFALLFAPERGLALRVWRVIQFRYRCICENVLKTFWRQGPNKKLSFNEINTYQAVSYFYLRFVLFRLVRNGWINKLDRNAYRLTKEGTAWAAKIIRLHRLWEVYLADYLGVGIERVHCSAEEMEHIITPEIEEQLIQLLHDPKVDPHHQPIPPREVL